MQRGGRQQLQILIQDLINRRAADLHSWLESRGGSPDAYLQEAENALYVFSQWSSWRRETNVETEDWMISKLGQFPSTGRCDALGRLLVELPNVSSEDVGHFPLVVHPAQRPGDGGRNEVKASVSVSRARTSYRGQGESSTKIPSSSLTVPDASSGAETRGNGTRYSIPSSSVSTSMQSLDKEQTGSAQSMDALASEAQRLRLGSDATCLELPILTVEYKKASDNLMKGTNQLRMYLTASVKFLQAVGITNVPVYGVQTDGPIVVLPAAVLRDDNVRSLFTTCLLLMIFIPSTVRLYFRTAGRDAGYIHASGSLALCNDTLSACAKSHQGPREEV